MTKRQLKKIKTMYHDGISMEICIASIIELMKDEASIEIAQTITAFIKELSEELK